MAEIVSTQAAAVAAGTKLSNVEALGRLHMVSINSPATAAWAENDTIASPVVLPVGTRITGLGKVFHQAMGTSVTMDIGIRQVDGTVIDVDGIADGLNVAAAGITDANTGLKVNDVASVYVTTVPCVIYATLLSANPTDDAQFRIDIPVVLPG